MQNLNDLKTSMVGTWVGWTRDNFRTDQRVYFEFHADGSYAAFNRGNTGVALYYGLDGTGDGREWDLDDIRANGVGRGPITIAFGAGSTTEGELDRVRICSNGQRLDFAFYATWLARTGPFQYRLMRQ